MKKLLHFIEQHFGLVFILAFACAFIFPELSLVISPLIVPILMVVMVLSFLKIDPTEVVLHFKKPLLSFYLLAVHLVVIPVAVFYLFQTVSQELAIGFLLLASVPTGVVSSAFSNIVGGNVALNVVLTVMSHLLAPFTMVGLFYMLTATTLQLDLWSMFFTLLYIIVLPLLLSLVLKRKYPLQVRHITPYATSITVICVFFLIYIAVGKEAHSFLVQEPLSVLWKVLLLYGYFIFTHVVGYFLPIGKSKDIKIASSIAQTYMNNSLAIVLAYKFFSPEVAFLMVLSEIPFGTMLAPFKRVLKYLS